MKARFCIVKILLLVTSSCLFPFLIFCQQVFYVDNIAGSDANNGTSPASAWQTINKVNATNFLPGDSILFKRGLIFNGALSVTSSGSANLPVVFGAYGAGAKPVINGFEVLSSWTSLGSNVYEASFDAGSSLNMVTINGAVQAMGRYPNFNAVDGGFLTIDAHAGITSITDAALTSAPNFTGAEVVIRKKDWVLDRCPITNHAASTVTYNSPTGHEPENGYGYFIQHSAATLDQQNEWYYDAVGKKIKLYSLVNPAMLLIRASAIDKLVNFEYRQNISFNNISFMGADVEAIHAYSCSNITIQQCSFDYTGIDAITGDNISYSLVENNTINYSNNSGMRITYSDHVLVKNNHVKNSGLIPGMGQSNNQQHVGIYFGDAETANIIENNQVDSSGYCGISFTGDSTLVKNNIISYFCLTVNDGGGIYTWGGFDKVGRKVIGNIIQHGIGAPFGTHSTVPGGAVGIYTDDRSSNVEMLDNTIAHCSRTGIFLHNSHEMILRNNTLFNNVVQLTLGHDDAFPGDPVRNNIFKGNIFFSKNARQFNQEVGTSDIQNNYQLIGNYDSNYYARPMDDHGVIITNYQDNGTVYGFYDLQGWKNKFPGFDVHSKESPVKIAPYTVQTITGANRATQTSIVSNAGTNYAYVNLGNVEANKKYLVTFNIMGVTNTENVKTYMQQNHGVYAPLTTPQYYKVTTASTKNEFLFSSSAAENVMLTFELFRVNFPVIINSIDIREVTATVTNPDDSIRFVVNETNVVKNVALDGNYRDVKNTVYASSINLQPFSSAVLIKISSAINQLPVADAGEDTTIWLPVDSVILNGTGSQDADGVITTYNWSKISGPSTYNIVDATSATPMINSLVSGLYQFKLLVTDNMGATAADTVELEYNPNAILPVKILQFNGRLLNKAVELLWATTASSKDDAFEVQHALDGIQYVTIGVVAGKNSGTADNLYNYMHLNPANELNYYRLKQVDDNGQPAYSKTVVVDNSNRVGLSVYPNPVKDVLNISLPVVNTISSLNIFDSNGRLVFNKKINSNTGNVHISIDNFSAGIYHITWHNEQQQLQLRFVKQ